MALFFGFQNRFFPPGQNAEKCSSEHPSKPFVGGGCILAKLRPFGVQIVHNASVRSNVSVRAAVVVCNMTRCLFCLDLRRLTQLTCSFESHAVILSRVWCVLCPFKKTHIRMFLFLNKYIFIYNKDYKKQNVTILCGMKYLRSLTPSRVTWGWISAFPASLAEQWPPR